MEFAAERAIGRERLQNRPWIGETRRFDDDPAEWRNRAALAVKNEPAQRQLQIGAGDAADAAIAKENGFFGAVANERIVDTDRAELVDDHRGAGAVRRLQEPADQCRLAGAEKSGDHGDRNARAALALKPPPERAGLARGEKVEHRSRSEIHLQNVQPADMAIDGINDASLIDKDIVHLDRAGRRAG